MTFTSSSSTDDWVVAASYTPEQLRFGLLTKKMKLFVNPTFDCQQAQIFVCSTD